MYQEGSVIEKVKLVDLLPLIKEAFANGQTVTIPVTGTSMRPTLQYGDVVTLASTADKTVVRGDVVLYRRENGQFVLHRAVRVKKDTVDFCGDAQVDMERDVPKSALIGVVIGYTKNGIDRDLAYVRSQGRQRLLSRPFRAAATKWHRFRKHTQTGRFNSTPGAFLMYYLKRHLLTIAVMCVLSCVSALSMLAMAYASGRIIDKALGDNMNHFAEWFLVLFGLLVIVAVCNVIYSNLRVRATGKMKNEIRKDLFSVLLTRRYTAMQDIHSGDVLNRMTSDIQIIVDGAVTLVPQAVSLGTKLIGGIAIMFFVEPIFTAALVVVGVAAGVALHFLSRYYKVLHKECQETEGKTRSYLQECIENLVVIKSFTNEKGVLSKLDEYQEDNYQKQVRRNFFGNIGNTGLYVGFTFAYYAGLAWGVLRMAGRLGTLMSIGTFTMFLQIMEQIRSPFRNASGLLPQYYSTVASAERLLDMFLLPREQRKQLSVSREQLYDKMQEISVDNVSFAYNDVKSVLCGATTVIAKNKLTALVGASGAGKSTLIKLLLGLLEPQEGQLVLKTAKEPIPIDASTRVLFSYVPQGNMILSGTLAENILFGKADAARDDVERAAKAACLWDTVCRLPDGLDTVVGERGVGLSEGQIQRVAIARALLSKAPILLMDECTSALDAATEQQVLDNLRTLTDRTILFISHRPAVLQSADYILRIADKQIESTKTM